MSSIPTSVYAALSAAAYADFLSTANRTWASELPSGWTYLPNYSKPDTSKGLSETLGFSASTFINGKNVVISFEGTDLSELGDAGKTAFDLLADIGLGLGSSLGLPQLVQAALVYEAVRKEYPADEDYSISFTGHSLGAGLASIMAVWFDQPATVFNDAPFLATADSTALATATNLALLAQGYNDQAFSDFLDKATLNNDLAGVTSRESLVNAYYTQGEVLNKRFGFAGNSGALFGYGTVYGRNVQMDIGGGSSVSASALHSVALATLLQMSSSASSAKSFQSDTLRLPTLLAELFSSQLYYGSSTGAVPDFMTSLMNASMSKLNSNGQAI